MNFPAISFQFNLTSRHLSDEPFSFRCGFSTPNSLCSLYFFASLSLFSLLSSCTLSFLRYALPDFSALTLLFRTKLTHPTALTSLARLTFFLCVLALLARKKIRHLSNKMAKIRVFRKSPSSSKNSTFRLPSLSLTHTLAAKPQLLYPKSLDFSR